ncbi:MAG: DUF2807 domain-containing protein [Bacteroidota bacterium]
MIKYSIILFSIINIFCSCNKEDAPDFLQSTGTITQETRILDNFNYVSLTDNIILDIVQDTCNWAVINAGKNLMPDIITKVSNGKLYISNENRFNWVRSYKYKIHITLGVKNLNYLNYQGYGNINFTNTLVADSFYFETERGAGHIDFNVDCKYSAFVIHAGTADLSIKGKSDCAYIYSFGYGPIEAQYFLTNSCAVHMKNLASAKVNVQNDLTATIENKGNIYYKGNPSSVKSNITGKGQLIKL